jgi:hypothetical protein
MFRGQPYCKACGYDGPNFLWSYHHHAGLSVLLCNSITNALRTIHIPDRQEFSDHSKSDDELESTFEHYINLAVAQHASKDEYRVDVVHFAMNQCQPTSLKCPECSELLYWRSTGIS